MGVKGLQSFLKKNPDISQKINLNETTLIIDANNLSCALFCNLCFTKEHLRCDLYGGDLVVYSEAVREFFKNIDKCNITPILVFDGSVIGKRSTQNQLVLKEKEVHRRGLQRFQAVKQASEENQNIDLVLPHTLYGAFRNVVSELGIQRIQTPYEADSHIARIANDLNCHVLTNDSDFLIYPLPKGFIMFDFFYYKDVKNIGKDKYSIQCINYSQEKLVKSVPGLKSESIPILAILLGNDYVTGMDRVLEAILPRYYQGSLVAESWSHRRIANLLYWMKNKSLNEAIETILSLVDRGDRDNLRNVVKILLRNYKFQDHPYLDKELEEVYPPPENDNEGQELKPSVFLRRLFERGDLDPIALDIIFRNTFYNYACIDDFQLPTAGYVRFRPVSIALTFLRQSTNQNLSSYQRQLASEKNAFILYDRIKEDYVKVKVLPLEELDGFGSIMHLSCYSLPSLEPALKKSMLMSIFRFNENEVTLLNDTLSQIFISDFLQEAVTCFILVKYIGIETKLSPKPQFVEALLLALFYYATLSGKLNSKVFETPDFGQVLLKMRPHSTVGNGHSYQQSTSLYRRILHFISQLQVSYMTYRLINSLLNNVMPNPRFEKFFNGTLIFRMTKLLRLKELELPTLCQKLPALVEVSGVVKVMVQCEE